MIKLNIYRNAAVLAILAATTAFSGCKTNQIIAKKLAKEFSNARIGNQYHIGFALYDKEKGQMIYEKDADKYYVPASNTKLFTLYAGLKILSDSVPSLRYVERGDSLIFWGTGDPSLLHKYLKGEKAITFLKQSNKKLFFAANRYTGDFYGRDWAWDDYNEYYQPEISELPLYGNVVSVTSKNGGDLTLLPKSFEACFVLDSADKRNDFTVKREISNNKFNYPQAKAPANYSQTVPYKTSTALTLTLLADTLKKDVHLVDYPMPSNAKTIFSSKSDDVFRQLMWPSDNFFAEQLLLTYADRLGINLNTTETIKVINDKYLSVLPDKVKWIDGSGLSKANLFTPRSIIKLLDLIYNEVNNQGRLFALLPAGGQSGTLKNAYPKTDEPFVFGKTGTLNGVHNQSGYIITKKGKLFYYSFLNNNFILPTADVRKEMVRIVTYIHDKF